MKIRHMADENDFRAIMRINALAWQEAYQDILPDEILQDIDVNPSERDIQEMYEERYSDRDRILVAEDDEEAIRGFSYVRWGDDTKEFAGEHEAGLKEIYVEPNYWNQGIGTQLLDRCLELLPDSIERVKLEMLSGNELAHHFYATHGFDRTGSAEFEIAGEPYPTDIYTLELSATGR